MQIVRLMVMLALAGTVHAQGLSDVEWRLQSNVISGANIVLVGRDTATVSLSPLQSAPVSIQWVRNGTPQRVTAVPWVGRHNESTITVTVFDKHRIVVVSSPNETYISNLTTSMNGALHAVDHDAQAIPSCNTEDISADELPRWTSIASRKPEGTAAQRTFSVPLSIDLDWQGRQQFASVEEATAYCTNVFASMQAQISTIPGAELVLANLRIWDTDDDPFPDEAVANPPAVRAFTEQLGTIFTTGPLAGTPGAVHALWTNRSNLSVGGVAGKIGGILDDTSNLFVAQIRKSSNFNAKISSHELGHVLGSPHTHSCLWPTGPIDSCWAPENGTCYDVPVKSEGTIMSYCDLPTAGGTVRPEFHPLTARVIRGYMMVAERLGGAELDAERAASVQGTVTFRGLPVAGVPLELIPVSTHPYVMPMSRRQTLVSSGDGTYKFDSVAPGYYAVAVTTTDWFWDLNYEFTTVRIVTDSAVRFDIALTGQRKTIRLVDANPAVPDVAIVWMNDIGQGLMGQMSNGVIEMAVYATESSQQTMTFFPFTPGVAWEPAQVDVDISGGGVVDRTVVSRATPNARTVAFRTIERDLDFERGDATLTTDMGIALSKDETNEPIQTQEANGRYIIVFADVPYGLHRADPLLDTTQYVPDVLLRFLLREESTPIYVISRRRSPAPFTSGYTISYPEVTPYTPISTSFVMGRGDTLDDQIYRFDLPFSMRVGSYETSTLHIHANGYVALGSPGVFTDIYQPLASVDPAYGHVAVLGGDLMGTSEARIGVQAHGRSPNRRVTVEWQNMMPYMESPIAGSVLTASVTFAEEGSIRLQYGPLGIDAPFEFAVGLRGVDRNDVSSLRATTSGEWAAPVRTTDPMAVCRIGDGVVPQNGMTIEWSPAGMSVAEAEVGYIDVLPQPATDHVVMQMPGQVPALTTVRLVNALGQSVAIPCVAEGSTVRFDVRGLTPGLYGVYFGRWGATILVGR